MILRNNLAIAGIVYRVIPYLEMAPFPLQGVGFCLIERCPLIIYRTFNKTRKGV